MKKLIITNGDNTRMAVDLIRYFKYKNDCFLIFSKGEIDEKNYHKLYLVRIMEELGCPVVQTIGNEADWAGMQGIIKKVIKELKRGKIKNFEDLDCKPLDGIKVENPRFFKLDQKLTDIISSNYFENEEISNQLESIDTTIMNAGQFNPTENISEINDNQGVLPNNSASYENTIQPNVETSNIEYAPVEPLPIYENEPSQEIPVSYENTVQPNVETSNMEYTPVEPLPTYENNEPSQEVTIPLENTVQPNVGTSNIEYAPVEPLPTYENVEQPMKPMEEISVSYENNIKPLSTYDNLQEKTVKIESNNQNGSQNIDYEAMYKALKEENDSTSAVIDDLLNQLLKYKEKYGEIE